MLACNAVQKRNKGGFFPDSFAPRHKQHREAHKSQTCLTVHCWHDFYLKHKKSFKKNNTCNSRKSENTWSLTAFCRPVFLWDQKLQLFFFFFRFPIDLFFLLSFFIYCWQIVDLPHLSFIFFLLSRDKGKDGTLGGSAVFGGTEGDYFGGWGRGCWIKTEVLALL